MLALQRDGSIKTSAQVGDVALGLDASAAQPRLGEWLAMEQRRPLNPDQLIEIVKTAEDWWQPGGIVTPVPRARAATARTSTARLKKADPAAPPRRRRPSGGGSNP